MSNNICPYCGSSVRNGKIGDIYCSNSHQDISKLDNGYFLLDLDDKNLTDKHFTRLSIRMTNKGSQQYIVNNQSKVIGQKTALLMNLGQQYRLQNLEDQNSHVVGVAFNPTFVSEYLKAHQFQDEIMLERNDENFEYNFNFALFQPSQKLYNSIEKLDVNSKFYALSRLELHDIYTDILDEVIAQEQLTRQKAFRLETAKKSTSIEIAKRLNQAKDYIESCYLEIESVEEVAQVASMSEFHFYRNFKKMFQLTPHQLIQKKRIEFSKKLVCTTDYTIGEICDLVGYQDQSSFTRLFKKYYKTSPADFRKSYKFAELT